MTKPKPTHTMVFYNKQTGTYDEVTLQFKDAAQYARFEAKWLKTKQHGREC